MSNPYPMPKQGEAQTLEKINEQLRGALELESMARIDARCLLVDLARGLVDRAPQDQIKSIINQLAQILS